MIVELARCVRTRAPAAGAAVLLAGALLTGCGGSSHRASGSGGPDRGSTTTGAASSPTSTATGPAATATVPTVPSTSPLGSLTVSPAQPTTQSELTFTFTAPVASGVHGSHVISYSLSLVGPLRQGCVDAHEAGAPQVAAGARGQIIVGPAQLHEPWCAGLYIGRLLELRSAHCTGSRPCPQYVSMAGLVGRVRYTVRRG